MPVLIFFGWVLGVAIGFILSLVFASAVSAFVPPALLAIASPFISWVGPLPSAVIALLAALLVVIAYVLAYRAATLAIAPSVSSVLQTAGLMLPLQSTVSTQASMPVVTIPSANGEFFARGVSIGLTAAINFVIWSTLPGQGIWVGLYCFIVVSLCTIISVARDRMYQGFLGWAGWILPLSYLASIVGLLLFVVNIIHSLITATPLGVRIDWTTGVAESGGGLAGIVSGLNSFSGGFSLGSFTFITSVSTASFTAPTLNAHETGHSLNTFAMGGVVLWINAVDENIFPKRQNLAYGELLAEGHASAMPGTPRNEFSYRLWF